MGGQLDPRSLAGPTGIIPTGLIRSGALNLRDYGAGGGVGGILSAPVVTLPGVAGVFNPVYSASGKGALSFLAFSNFDTGSRTLFMRVTIDGNRVFDVNAAPANSQYVCTLVGTYFSNLAATAPDFIPEPLLFEKSLLIEFSSTTTDANSARMAYRVIPR